MLKERLLTALVAGSALLAGLMFLNPVGVGVLLGAVTLLAAFEWSSLTRPGTAAGLAFTLLTAVVGVVSLVLPLGFVVAAALAWWAWAAGEVFVFRDRASLLWRQAPIKWLAGLLILVPTWRGCFALVTQDPTHHDLLIWLFTMVWVGDSAAYFAGRAFGRHKLAPLVSPGKTVEGAVAGIAGAAVVGGTGAWWLGVLQLGMGGGVVLGVAIGMLSIVGDLLESKAKRLASVKDSGRWLPGHGGVLDRIDALTAAVPLFVWTMRDLGVLR